MFQNPTFGIHRLGYPDNHGGGVCFFKRQIPPRTSSE
jgi:hypothetical protein